MKHLFDMTIQVTEKEGNFIKKCIKKALKILEKNCDKKQQQKKKVKSKQKHRKQTVKYGIHVKRGI